MYWPSMLMLLILVLTAGVLAKPEPQAEAGSEFLFSSSNPADLYKSNYSRLASVQEICSSALPNPNPDPKGFNVHDAMQSSMVDEKLRTTIISNAGRLSFRNGNWWQAAGSSPLLPFVSNASAFRLASFYISDVDKQWGHSYNHGQQVNVSGVLSLQISSGETFPVFPGNNLGGFQMEPGFSLLTVLMEGVYTELLDGERRLCLLGCTRLPLRGKNASDPWDQSSAFSPHLSDGAECQIVADISFPERLTLLNRAVIGTITSLRSPDDGSYFEPVKLSSYIDSQMKYKFESGDLVKTGCSAAVEFDSGDLSDDLAYRGENFCTSAAQVMGSSPVSWMSSVLPDLKCPLSEAECTGLGPFVVDGGFSNGTQLLMEDFRCVEFDREDGSGRRANVSAVLRAVPSTQLHSFMPYERTGLDNHTLVVEGEWSKASGKLCMIGCRNDQYSHTHSSSSSSLSCDTRITMYIPLTLSLKQRGVLLGTISSLSNGSSSFYPLSFRIPLQNRRIPTELWNSNSPYKFTKMEEAGALLDRDEPVGFIERIQNLLLKYPSVDSKTATAEMADDLSFFSELTIIANGNSENPPAFIKSSVELYISVVEDNLQKDQILRVAGFFMFQTSIKGVPSYLSIEGEYDPAVGRMHLLGCGELQATWKFLHENAHLLEDGLDCRLSMKVRFPPWNIGWLKNPTVKLSLSSTRNRDDPLHFSTLEMETLPISYKRHMVDLLWQKKLEVVLSIVTVSFMISCTISQLFYMGRCIESIPYISQITLAIQALGYTLPILTGSEYLFGRLASDFNYMSATTMDYSNSRNQIISGLLNVVSLFAFSLTIRLAQKVHKSRIQLLTRRPLEPCRVPREWKVFCICFGFHFLAFTALVLGRPLVQDYLSQGRIAKQPREWERQLVLYLGLLNDLFLLPQVVANYVWEVEGIKRPKAMRKLFYMGLTALRLLPHIYNSRQPPVFQQFSSFEYQYGRPPAFNDFQSKLNFYSKAGDIAICVIVVLLVVVLHIQQEDAKRWKGGLQWGMKKVWKWDSSRRSISPRMGSAHMYESLPSQSLESEMVMESESKLKVSEGCSCP